MKQSVNAKNGSILERIGRMIPVRGRGLIFCLAALALALALALTATGPAQALSISDAPHRQTWITNGTVNAIARTSDTIYLGGMFSYVGPLTGSGARLDPATGKLAGAFPKVNGDIRACVADGAGGWFIGGDFQSVGGVNRTRLAHILASGELDPAWNAGADGYVYALAVSNGVVYVGGYFAYINGQWRGGLAALDAATGVLIPWNPALSISYDNYVLALAVSDGVVYAGGNFLTNGSPSCRCLAALDATTGALIDWKPQVNGVVRAVAVADGVVYVGGDFSELGDQWRNHIGALDAATGAVTDWDPWVVGDGVQTLAVSGSTVYAGGKFTAIGGQDRNSLAALDKTTGDATAWNPGANLNSTVSALAVAGQTVYAGGDFATLDGQPRNRLAALDATTGAATAWDPGANNPVNALAVAGGEVLVGGTFTSTGGLARNNLAALDATTGAATAWNPGANNMVLALAISGKTIYTGGAFTIIGGQTRNYLAALDATTGAATAWDPGLVPAVHLYDHVNSLAVLGGVVYPGGSYLIEKINNPGEMFVDLVALDTTTGAVTAWNPGTHEMVNALAVSGGLIYAGGAFTYIGGQNRNYLAALDATTGAVTAWNPGADNIVNALAVSGGLVYAGGSFSTIGDKARAGVAALDTASGAVSTWNPGLSGGSVNALAVSGGVVYVGGDFTSVGGRGCHGLAALDTAARTTPVWIPSISSIYGSCTVNALSVLDSTIYVGGSFANLGESGRNYFAQYNFGNTVSFQTDGLAGATLSGAATQTVEPGADCAPVTANAPTGYHFVKWTTGGADYATTNPLTVAHVTAPLTLKANFAHNVYTFSCRTDGTPGATLSGTTPQTIDHGSSSTAMTANVPAGYRFVKWLWAGQTYSTANPITVTGMARNLELIAKYERIIYTVNFATDGTAGATLRGRTSQQAYQGTPTMAVLAIAPTGYHFDKWTKGGAAYSTANPLAIKAVTEDMTLTAVYARNTYTVSFKTDGTRGATLSGSAVQRVLYGYSTSSVWASPPTGYRFVRWISDGANYSTDNSLVVYNVAANMTLTACFEQIKCTVTFATDGTRGATLSGRTAQTGYYGMNCQAVTANAPIGYHFVNWLRYGASYSTANPLTLTNVTGDLTLVASFSANIYTIAFKTDGTRGAKLTGVKTQTVRYGANSTAVKAVAPKGYRFVKWTRNGGNYSTNNPLTISNVKANRTLVATFKKK